jgi:hypothetical protein
LVTGLLFLRGTRGSTLSGLTRNWLIRTELYRMTNAGSAVRPITGLCARVPEKVRTLALTAVVVCLVSPPAYTRKDIADGGAIAGRARLTTRVPIGPPPVAASATRCVRVETMTSTSDVVSLVVLLKNAPRQADFPIRRALMPHPLAIAHDSIDGVPGFER